MKLFLPLFLIAAIFAVAYANPEPEPILEPYDSPIQQNVRSGRYRVCNRNGYCRDVWYG